MNKSIFLIFCFFSFASCSFLTPKSVVLNIKGSDTMLNFTQLLASEYMKRNPHVAIYISGGGSREGIESLADLQSDIATASRLMTPEEVKILADKHGTIGVSFLIAKDAISVYVNPKNLVGNLSLDQLRKIFTCRINNWAEVGGEDLPIHLFTRNPNSGTYIYFSQFVLAGEKYCPIASAEPSLNRLVSKISKDVAAIGYGGIGAVKGVKRLKINDIEPTEDNVRSDAYPICRYLYFFTLKQPRGEVKNFIDWTLSNEAQTFIRKSGYVPIWKVTF